MQACANLPASAVRRSARPQGGFSLIEVATVLTILGILVLAAAPEISAQLRNAQIRNAADSLQAGLQRARTEAIRRNQNVRFSLVDGLTADCRLSSTAGSWVVSIDDPSNRCATPASESVAPQIVAVQSAADGNAFAKVVATRIDGGGAASSIVFDSFGRPIDGEQIGQIVLSSSISPSDYRIYRVDVSPAGGVRMCDTRLGPTSSDPRRCLS